MTRVQTLSDIRALHSPSWGDGSVPGFTVPEQRKAFPTLVAQAQPEGCLLYTSDAADERK